MHEHGEPHAVDADARHARGVRVVADGEHVRAEAPVAVGEVAEGDDRERPEDQAGDRPDVARAEHVGERLVGDGHGPGGR